MPVPVPLTPELDLAIQQARAEGIALGRYPSVERLIHIADKYGAHWAALLAATVRLLPEVDHVYDTRPARLDLTGRLAPLDETDLRFNRAWVLADSPAVFAVLSRGKPPHALVYDTAGQPVSPSQFRARSRKPEPVRPILRKPKATEVV